MRLCRYLQQTDANLLGFGEDEGDEEGEEGEEGSEEDDTEEEEADGKKTPVEKKGKLEVRCSWENMVPSEMMLDPAGIYSHSYADHVPVWPHIRLLVPH